MNQVSVLKYTYAFAIPMLAQAILTKDEVLLEMIKNYDHVINIIVLMLLHMIILVGANFHLNKNCVGYLYFFIFLIFMVRWIMKPM